MKKRVLFEKTEAVANETKTALETMYDALNQGQQKKILKNETVKKMFTRHGVERGE